MYLSKKNIAVSLNDFSGLSESELLDLGFDRALELFLGFIELNNENDPYLSDIKIRLINNALNKITINTHTLTEGFGFHDYEKAMLNIYNKPHLRDIYYVQRALFSRLLMEWDYSLLDLCAGDTSLELFEKTERVEILFSRLKNDASIPVEDKTVYERFRKQFLRTLGSIMQKKLIRKPERAELL